MRDTRDDGGALPVDGASSGTSGSGTSGSASGEPVDAGPPSCFRAKFTSVRRLDELHYDKKQFQITLRADEKQLFITRATDNTGTNGFDVFTATRADLDASFGGFSVFAPAHSDDNESTAALNASGTELVFTSNRTGTGIGLWHVTHSLNDFGAASAIVPQEKQNVSYPQFALDELWYSVASANTIYRVRKDGGAYGAPEARADLSFGDYPGGLAFDQQGLTVFVGLNRANGVGGGLLDIWTAHRASIDEPFGDPKFVADENVNSGSTDRPMWLSPDGCRLYLQSDRLSQDAGYYDFFVAERTKE